MVSMDAPISCRKLVELHAAWCKLRGDRAMPSRRDLDVTTLKPWLGNLTLLAVIEGGRDFLFRVHGSNLRDIVGQDLTGKRLSEVRHQWAAVWFEEYRKVVDTRMPLFKARRPSVTKDHIVIEKLMLPLAADGGGVDTILYAVYPASRPAPDFPPPSEPHITRA